jgi:hypothetical protein
VRGQTEKWRVHRYKDGLDNVAGAVGNIGQSNDTGIDVAIGSIPVSVTSDTTYCQLPTQKDLSAMTSLYGIKVHFGTGTAALQDVDLRIYELVEGTTGIGEYWHLLKSVDNVNASTPPILVPSARGQIFVRIDNYGVAPDAAGSMYIMTKVMARADQCIDVMVMDDLKSELVDINTELDAQTALLTTIDADTSAINTATAAIQTSVELLDDVVEDHDSVLSDAAILKVGGQAHVGTPPAVADLDVVRLALDTLGSLKVHSTRALNYSTDSITTEPRPPTTVRDGSRQISNAAATALSATSIPCREVTVYNRVGNSPIAVAGSTVASAAGGRVLAGGQDFTIPINDVAKVYGYATVNNEILNYVYVTD